MPDKKSTHYFEKDERGRLFLKRIRDEILTPYVNVAVNTKVVGKEAVVKKPLVKKTKK